MGIGCVVYFPVWRSRLSRLNSHTYIRTRHSLKNEQEIGRSTAFTPVPMCPTCKRDGRVQMQVNTHARTCL